MNSKYIYMILLIILSCANDETHKKTLRQIEKTEYFPFDGIRIIYRGYNSFMYVERNQDTFPIFTTFYVDEEGFHLSARHTSKSIRMNSVIDFFVQRELLFLSGGEYYLIIAFKDWDEFIYIHDKRFFSNDRYRFQRENVKGHFQDKWYHYETHKE
jgi:hypothetical protein